MESSGIDHIISIDLYLPTVRPEELDRALDVTERVEQHFSLTGEDASTIRKAHARVFDRLLQIDPTLRHDRISEPERARRTHCITRVERMSKAEAKTDLQIVHRVFDKYAVPVADRRAFFIAITSIWYFIRAMAYTDDAQMAGKLVSQ